MKILVEVLPENGRKLLYVLYALAGLILGAWSVADQPDWLTTALAVYAFVGTALGLVAEANTGVERGLDAEYIERYAGIDDDPDEVENA